MGVFHTAVVIQRFGAHFNVQFDDVFQPECVCTNPLFILIVIGNTGFPILLRFIIWVMFKTARPLSLYKESLGFLLDHPRRCFTLLFPSVPTWWLFFILVVLNGFDLVIFCILDLHDDTFDMGYRVLNGLFQAFCTRTVGFSVMDLSQLHAATQVSYLIMMYISVLPIAISVRRTNVYEEQSLGCMPRRMQRVLMRVRHQTMLGRI